MVPQPLPAVYQPRAPAPPILHQHIPQQPIIPPIFHQHFPQQPVIPPTPIPQPNAVQLNPPLGPPPRYQPPYAYQHPLAFPRQLLLQHALGYPPHMAVPFGHAPVFPYPYVTFPPPFLSHFYSFFTYLMRGGVVSPCHG